MASSNTQDFKVITLRRTLTREEKAKDGQIIKATRPMAGKNTQSKPGIDLRKIENEEVKLPRITKSISKKITDARVALGWDQTKLATMASLPRETIRDYENGKAIVKQAELNKINRALKISVKRPKLEKMAVDDGRNGRLSAKDAVSTRVVSTSNAKP